ncbi:MAG: hypothetical protein LBB23_03990 [Rickettsiales bacterium]|nr:hypothetical protein [Rickettsiales bacterium]
MLIAHPVCFASTPPREGNFIRRDCPVKPGNDLLTTTPAAEGGQMVSPAKGTLTL